MLSNGITTDHCLDTLVSLELANSSQGITGFLGCNALWRIMLIPATFASFRKLLDMLDMDNWPLSLSLHHPGKDYLAISSQTCLFQTARILSLCLWIK